MRKIAFGCVELILLVLFLRQIRRKQGTAGGEIKAMKTSTLSIRTPEGMVFSQWLAGPVTRFLAWFIDQLCIQVVLTILGIGDQPARSRQRRVRGRLLCHRLFRHQHRLRDFF